MTQHQRDDNRSFWINQRPRQWVLLPDTAFATLRIFHTTSYFCIEWTWVPRFEPDSPLLRLFLLAENVTTPYLMKNDRIEIKGVYVFRLTMTVLRDLPRLKYLTTKANNYWKTIAKKVIYIPRTMPKSVRIFSLFSVNDARLRSNFKNSRFVLHRGFQTLENSKSTRPTASCFHQFSRVWKPRWNTRTRFWNITWNVSDIELRMWNQVSYDHRSYERTLSNCV